MGTWRAEGGRRAPTCALEGRVGHGIYLHLRIGLTFGGRYDWRAEEAALNKELPMFTRDISVEGHGALNIHYVHRRSTVRGAVPLLFVHGCKHGVAGVCPAADDV